MSVEARSPHPWFMVANIRTENHDLNKILTKAMINGTFEILKLGKTQEKHD